MADLKGMVMEPELGLDLIAGRNEKIFDQCLPQLTLICLSKTHQHSREPCHRDLSQGIGHLYSLISAVLLSVL